MNDVSKGLPVATRSETLSPGPLTCDPGELRALDEEDRRADDTSAGIDWDGVIAGTQRDIEAGIYAYDSAAYPTEEAAMAALKQLIHQAAEEGRRGIVAAY